MRIDVFPGAPLPATADVSGRVVVVIDVLRASTTIATALANGARNIIPFDSTDDAVARSKSFERGEVRLAGERRMRAMPGFDFGNSPLEFTREAVGGKTVLFSTTNGTGALVSVQGARDVVVGAYVNFSAVLTLLRAAVRGETDVAILCAGRDRQFSLEDTACAGRFVRHVRERYPDVELNDGALAALHVERAYGDDIERLFLDSSHGRDLRDAGFGADLRVCAALDTYPVIPLYQDRQITMLGPDRAR